MKVITNMPFINNEQEEKNQSIYLTINDKSKIHLLSRLYKVQTYFVRSLNKSIWGEDIVNKAEAEKDTRRRVEYIYWAIVDGQEGIVRLPASVFFSINDAEKMLGSDKRGMEFFISKSGSGLNTKYGVTRGRDVPTTESQINDANKKLAEQMMKYEKSLKQNLADYVGQAYVESGGNYDVTPTPNVELPNLNPTLDDLFPTDENKQS